MHIVFILALAFVVGWLQSWLAPKISAALPASITGQQYLSILVNGALILFVVFVGVWAVHAVGLRGKKMGA